MRGPHDAVSLVESDAGPLILWWSSPTHRYLVVGFDMFASRWPLRVSFPVFLANAVRYLGGVQTQSEASMVRSGRTITFSAPPDANAIQLTRPGGETESVAVEGGRVSFGDTVACGPYSFQVYQDKAKTYAVNLLDARESNTEPRKDIQWRETKVAGTTKALKENRELWPWFVWVALAVLMIEWYVYHRRAYL